MVLDVSCLIEHISTFEQVHVGQFPSQCSHFKKAVLYFEWRDAEVEAKCDAMTPDDLSWIPLNYSSWRHQSCQ